jgi:surface protein
MSYVPDFVALYEICPYIRKLALDNETIRVAVKDYLEGGERKADIIKKYGKIGDWNTSEVTDMSGLFRGFDFDNELNREHTVMRNFNEDISKWDTSKVTTMKGMFMGAESFNQPIGKWDTSNVTDMEGMFLGAESFNQPIVGWNTSKVSNMSCMFCEATSFNLENAP